MAAVRRWNRAGSGRSCGKATNTNQSILFEKGIDRVESIARRKKGLTAEVMLCSINALTEDGALVNIDSLGNRVAAMLFGPDKVILAMGMNKVQSDLEAAWKRLRQIIWPNVSKRTM